MDAEGSKDPNRKDLLVGIAAALTLPVFVAVVYGYSYNATRHIRAAEDRLTFLERNGASKDELCAARRSLQEAYLIDDDGAGYREARVHADVICQSAELDRIMRR